MKISGLSVVDVEVDFRLKLLNTFKITILTRPVSIRIDKGKNHADRKGIWLSQLWKRRGFSLPKLTRCCVEIRMIKNWLILLRLINGIVSMHIIPRSWKKHFLLDQWSCTSMADLLDFYFIAEESLKGNGANQRGIMQFLLLDMVFRSHSKVVIRSQ